ncbi:MFS transporter [Salibacterium qingdaonense]|uniref:MFS transporter, YNFM family, putative membrane transport protein n=1 Tax=Salibacterium qingdaonense TaxID=266892 RepID=A0A1I4LBM6_9BACI|nr:MFS transporter [Salibacterium qingdaonense]SFL88340.1 MFS transporter, YNFM family, putative membrane transport protein [Salibacterium qingdaonense]
MIDIKTKAFWRATLALGAAAMMTFANLYFPQPLLPHFSESFGVSETTASLLVSVPLFVLGITFFVYTALSDAFGRRPIIFTALGLGTLGTIAVSAAPTFEVMLAGRIFQAAGLAGIPVAAMAYISEEFKMRAMTVAVGAYISCNSLGGMSGRVLSGVLTDIWNWRTAFIVMTVLSVILTVLVYMLLPRSQEFQGRPLKLKTIIQDNKDHLASPLLRGAYIIGGLHFLLFMGIFTFITYYLSQEPFHASTGILGLLFLTYSAGTVSSTLAGKAAQRWKQTVCMFTGMACMAVSLAATLVPVFPVIIAALLLLCFGFFFTHSTSSAWVTRHAAHARASASGLYLTSYYIGGSLGSLYYGVLWTWLGWNAVIFGSFAILIITTIVTAGMKRMENQLPETGEG